MRKLNLKRWLFLFLTTLLLGGVTVLITGAVLGWNDMIGGQDTASEMFAAAIWLFIVGLMFSVLSQMGFFAYLTLHRFGLGIFKGKKMWNAVQILLILFVFFDLVYLRYYAFAEAGETWLDYIWLPIILLVVATVGAFFKARMTTPSTFIPALFFIYVITTVEVVPAIVQNDPNWVILMLVPVLVCNVWQLLILHKLTAAEQKKSA